MKKDRACSRTFYGLSVSQVWQDLSLFPNKSLQGDKSLPGQKMQNFYNKDNVKKINQEGLASWVHSAVRWVELSVSK